MPLPQRDAPRRRRLLSDVLYDRLLEAIVGGELQPDEPVSDGSIAAWSGMSRTPAREALDRLALRGLVVVQPRRPSRIAPLDAEMLASTLEALGCLLPSMARTVVHPGAAIVGDTSTGDALVAPDGVFERIVLAYDDDVMTAQWEELVLHVRRYWNLRPDDVPAGIEQDTWASAVDGETAARVIEGWFE